MRKVLLLSALACLTFACDEAVEPAPDDGVVAEPTGEAGEGETGEAAADAAAADEGAADAPAEPVLPERRFVEVKGDVKIDGEAAAADMEIGVESSLETGKDGYAIITVEKGSTIEVRANSSLKFGSSDSAKISVALAFGTLWSFMADETSYEIVTANTVAGVRGTIFFVQVDKPKKKKKKKKTEQTYVCACHGKVGIKGVNPKSFDEVVHSPSEDHKAFDIVTRAKKQRKRKAGRRNHTDAEKMALMPYMEKTK
jgi:hypothetical protein